MTKEQLEGLSILEGRIEIFHRSNQVMMDVNMNFSKIPQIDWHIYFEAYLSSLRAITDFFSEKRVRKDDLHYTDYCTMVQYPKDEEFHAELSFLRSAANKAIFHITKDGVSYLGKPINLTSPFFFVSSWIGNFTQALDGNDTDTAKFKEKMDALKQTYLPMIFKID